MKKVKVLQNKNFKLLAIANTISRFGDSLETLAMSWLVYEMTGSLTIMGALATVNFLPNLIVTPFAGVLADRYDRKKISLFGKLVRGVNAMVLFFLITFDILPVFYLFIYAIINSTFESLGSPSSTAWTSELLNPDEYTEGASLMASFASFGELLGMASAGIIVAVGGMQVAFIIDAVTFFIAAFLIARVAYTFATKSDEEFAEIKVAGIKGYFTEIHDGFKYVLSQRLIFISVFMAAMLNMFFTPMNVLMPIYVDQNLGLGVNGMSMISGMLMFGILIGGILVAILVKKISGRWLVIGGYFLVGLFYVLLGVIGALEMTTTLTSIFIMVNSFFFGFVIPAIAAPLQGYLFKVVPVDKRGRTFSILSMMTLAMIPIASALIAFIGDAISVLTYFYSMGFAVMLLAVYLFLQKDFREFKVER